MSTTDGVSRGRMRRSWPSRLPWTKAARAEKLVDQINALVDDWFADRVSREEFHRQYDEINDMIDKRGLTSDVGRVMEARGWGASLKRAE